MTTGAVLPLLFSFRRAVALAVSFRDGDFFCADCLAAARDLAAREAGLLDFFLTDCFLAILLSLFVRTGKLTHVVDAVIASEAKQSRICTHDSGLLRRLRSSQ